MIVSLLTTAAPAGDDSMTDRPTSATPAMLLLRLLLAHQRRHRHLALHLHVALDVHRHLLRLALALHGLPPDRAGKITGRVHFRLAGARPRAVVLLPRFRPILLAM